MVADELVQEGSRQSADERAHEVDPQLAEVLRELRVADEALDEQRADLARRVQRGASDRTDQDDDSVDDEADDDPGEARGRATVDGGAKYREHEARRADGLGSDGDQRPGRAGVVANRAQTERRGVVAE